MKKSLLNLGTAIKKAEQKAITGGYGGGGGYSGPPQQTCCYQVSAASGIQTADCYTAQRIINIYGSPTGSYWPC
jgi:hypothetical protein